MSTERRAEQYIARDASRQERMEYHSIDAIGLII